MSGGKIYLKSLNENNFRHNKEAPIIIGIVRYGTKNFYDKPCFKVKYKSDNEIKCILCREFVENKWGIV